MERRVCMCVCKECCKQNKTKCKKKKRKKKYSEGRRAHVEEGYDYFG